MWPAPVTASHGSVSSTSSTPSAAVRNAIRLDMPPPLLAGAGRTTHLGVGTGAWRALASRRDRHRRDARPPQRPDHRRPRRHRPAGPRPGPPVRRRRARRRARLARPTRPRRRGRARPRPSACRCPGRSNADAAAAGDVVLVVVPWDGHAELLESLSDELAGKIVVDCVNPLGFDKQGPFALQVEEGSATQQAAAILTGSRVVGAFHNVSAVLLEDPEVERVETDVLVLGDDREATDLVQALADVVPGMRGVYGGRLRNAHQVEAFTANLIAINRRYKAHAGCASPTSDRAECAAPPGVATRRGADGDDPGAGSRRLPSGVLLLGCSSAWPAWARRPPRSRCR